MLLLALFLVAVTTVADFTGAAIVVWGFYRPTIVRLIVNFAVGTLLAVSVVDLLPEALALRGDAKPVLLAMLIGIVAAFLFERFIAWYHCHDDHCETHPASPGRKAALLAGSAVEEFIDGAAVGLALLVGTQNPQLAFLTTLAIFAHELPETASKVATLATFGVPPKKAMLLVLATALAGFIGAASAVLFAGASAAMLPFLLALVAGIFIYIATADLIPELHSTFQRSSFVWEVFAMLAGLALILVLGLLE